MSSDGTNPRATPASSGFEIDDLEEKAQAHDHHERDDQRFEQPEALVLQVQDQEHIERRDEHAPGQRNVEEQIERDGGADHLGEVAGRDGDLAQHPQRERHGLRIVIAAGLRQVAPGDDAQLGGEPLQQDRHQVGDEDDAEERVPELRPARQVGGPVAGVHVAHRDQIARAGKGEELAPPRQAMDGDRAMDLGQRRRQPRAPPP